MALIGVGDAAIFGGNYVESMKHFYDAVSPKGAKIVRLCLQMDTALKLLKQLWMINSWD